MYESEFEEHLLSQAPHIYPHHHLVRFKPLLVSEHGSAKPDLALIDKQYRNWWIVEVELGTHSFEEHVQKQVRVFATAEYGRHLTPLLMASAPWLHQPSVEDMLIGDPPRILVLVNEAKPDWAVGLQQWDIILGIVEIFRNDRNQVILRVNGEHPSDCGAFITSCRVDPHLRRSLVIESPGGVGVRNGQEVELWFEGGITQWRRVDAGGSALLMPLNRCPLSGVSGRYDIVRADDGRLMLTKRQETRDIRRQSTRRNV